MVVILALSLAACQGGIARPTLLPSTLPATATVTVTRTPPVLGAIPSSTTEAAIPSLATPTPSPTPPPSSTPTFAGPLVQPLPFEPPVPLPEGFSLQLYALGRPVVAGEFGYPQIHNLLDPDNQPKEEVSPDPIARRMETLNASLEPIGYHLERVQGSYLSDHYYALYRGETLLLDQIAILSRLSANRSQTDFVLVVEQSKPSQTPAVFLVRKAGLEQLPYTPEGGWGKYSHGGWPQFSGDELIYAAEGYDPVEGWQVVSVHLNDQEIYRTTSQTIHVRPPLVGLWTYPDAQGEDHWALEVLDEVSLDGVSMNAQHGYQKSHNFHLLGGRPVFLFERDGQLGLNLDGSEVLLPGERAPHDNCCVPAMLNPLRSEQGLAFFIQDGERWLYAELAAP